MRGQREGSAKAVFEAMSMQVALLFRHWPNPAGRFSPGLSCHAAAEGPRTNHRDCHYRIHAGARIGKQLDERFHSAAWAMLNCSHEHTIDEPTTHARKSGNGLVVLDTALIIPGQPGTLPQVLVGGRNDSCAIEQG